MDNTKRERLEQVAVQVVATCLKALVEVSKDDAS